MRHETFQDGTCIHAEVIDLDAGTFTVEDHGEVVSTRALTLDERRAYGPQPLEAVGALATLLAVEGVLGVEDAANAVGLTPEQLVTEAQGWSAAEELNADSDTAVDAP
jgi:hypothetical protein